MPTYSAVGEYHNNTSVESAAAMPSTGENCEKPVRTAACCHTGLVERSVDRRRRGLAFDARDADVELIVTPNISGGRRRPGHTEQRRREAGQQANMHVGQSWCISRDFANRRPSESCKDSDSSAFFSIVFNRQSE